jgi:hypothetical protein
VSIAVQKNRDNYDRHHQQQHHQHQQQHYGMDQQQQQLYGMDVKDIPDSVIQAIAKQLQGNFPGQSQHTCQNLIVAFLIEHEV